MNFKLGIAAVAASIAIASSAYSASLSIVGGVDRILPDGTVGDIHDPDYTGLAADLLPTVGVGDTVKAFGINSNDPLGYEEFDGTNGLMLSDARSIQITFLGKEANATNVALNKSGGVLNNQSSLPGESIVTFDLPDWVDIVFETFHNGVTRSIENNTGVLQDDFLSIAYFQEDSKNVLAFFGDGRRDNDFDDMVVRISIIPLPAGGVLLLTALGGLVLTRRRKKA